MIKVILVAIVALMMVFLLFLYLFPIVRVEGDSMLPTLIEGEYVLCRRLFFKGKKSCETNKLYIVHLRNENNRPYYVVKRLTKVMPDGTYWFLGDNSTVSYDSRHYGSVEPNKVMAVIIDKKVK